MELNCTGVEAIGQWDRCVRSWSRGACCHQQAPATRTRSQLYVLYVFSVCIHLYFMAIPVKLLNDMVFL